MTQYRKQRTIAGPFEFSGIGIHTGKTSKIRVEPAPVDNGIVFVRDGVRIKAVTGNITGTARCTTLGRETTTVSTVEHLMACCFGFGLDNLTITIEGPEMPILDGSARETAQKITDAGIRNQEREKTPLIVNKTVCIENAGSMVTAVPSEGFGVTVVVDYNHPVIGVQGFHYSPGDVDFQKELAPARTFGFREELDALLEKNQALGGSLENALVVEKDRYMNPTRFPDEVVRHKCLDFLGDLALADTYIRGQFFAYRPGHGINSMLTARLSAQTGF